MTILNKEKILEVAKAFVDDGKLDRAIREYEKIILADPTDVRVKLRVAELHTKRKEIPEAIRLYREVADTYEEEGFFLKAVTVSKSILRLNPSLIEVNERLAHLYEKMGLLSDAMRQYGILASSLDAKGMKDRVIEIRSKIVNLMPDDMTARVRLAELYQREGKMEEAIEQYEKLSIQLEKSGKNRAKLADLIEKILSHRPDQRDKIMKLIDLYAELGENKKALKWLDAGGEIVEKDPRLLKLSADLYCAQNQNETARIRYMKLADLASEAGDLVLALDAYYHVFLLYPDEEERLAPQIEALKAGATKELSIKAQKKREEIEAMQSAPDEDTADEGEPVKSYPQTTKVSVVEEEPKVKAPVAAPAPHMDRTPEDVTDKLKMQKVELPKKPGVPAGVLMKSADASLNLAMAYERMGLKDESLLELKKARRAYASIIGSDSHGQLARKRIAEIDLKLGIRPTSVRSEEKKASERAPEKTVIQKVVRPPAPPIRRHEPKEEKKSEDEAKKPAKKRISFV